MRKLISARNNPLQVNVLSLREIQKYVKQRFNPSYVAKASVQSFEKVPENIFIREYLFNVPWQKFCLVKYHKTSNNTHRLLFLKTFFVGLKLLCCNSYFKMKEYTFSFCKRHFCMQRQVKIGKKSSKS